MPMLTTDDGVDLYYEETGTGTPIVFVHEFAGDYRSYEPQVRYFNRRYRCIAYNARGYPPSMVPESVDRYSQTRACDDIRAVLDALEIDKAHVVGVSMGAFATVHFGLTYPERALSLVAGGCGYGAPREVREQFQSEAEAMAQKIMDIGMAHAAEDYALTGTRIQYLRKDPRGWAEFKTMLAEHSTLGSANTMRGVQAKRPSLFDLDDPLSKLSVALLVIAGDEDDPCLDTSLYLKRTVPSSALALLPKTGHALNLEEPALFNQLLGEFFHEVETGRWEIRVLKESGGSILSRESRES